MSNQGKPVRSLSTAVRSWVVLIVAGLALAGSASAAAQEKSFSERVKDYWERVVTGLESGAKLAGDEYQTLKSRAATATGPAREKIVEEMEVAGKKWATAREKLASSLERHAHEVHDEIKALEERSETATGPARDKMTAEAESLRKHWDAAREKMSAALSSNMKAAGDEYAHLKDEAARATDEARSKFRPRMERLSAEWVKNREKLSAHLKADLKRAEEELQRLEDATSETAKAAKEKLSRKLQELRGKFDALAAAKAPDEAQ